MQVGGESSFHLRASLLRVCVIESSGDICRHATSDFSGVPLKLAIMFLALSVVVACDRQPDPAPPPVPTTASFPDASATAGTAYPDAPVVPPVAVTNTTGRPVATPPPSHDPDSAPRVQVGEVQQLLKQDAAVLLDVRNRTAFEMEHAAGAVNIPLEELPTRAGELPRNKYIAAYCT